VASRSTDRVRVAAAAIVAVVAVALLLRTLRDPRVTRPAVASEALSAAEPTVGDASDPPRGVPSAPPAFAAADAAPSTRAETIARLGVARGKLRAAATPCWRAHAAASRPPPAPGVPDETLGMLRFHYALAVHRGEAEVENVEVLESSVVDHELDTCIRDAVAHARWPAPGPDGLLEVEDRIRIGDLTIPEAPPDPKMR